jgi:hypothetical protein
MTTLSEYNEEQSKKYDDLHIGKNGIKCPICGEEMWDGDPRLIIATFPPKRKVFCKSCKHIDYKVL